MDGTESKRNKDRGKPAPESAEARQARADFKRGVLARGEAAKRTKEGKLPPGATHEIVDGDLVRRRFSAV